MFYLFPSIGLLSLDACDLHGIFVEPLGPVQVPLHSPSLAPVSTCYNPFASPFYQNSEDSSTFALANLKVELVGSSRVAKWFDKLGQKKVCQAYSTNGPNEKNCLASILQAHLRKGHPWPARAIGFWDQRRWRANSNTKRLDQQKFLMWKLHNLGLFPGKFKQFSLRHRAFCRVQNGYNWEMAALSSTPSCWTPTSKPCPEGFGSWRQLIAGGLGHPKPSVKIVNNSCKMPSTKRLWAMKTIFNYLASCKLQNQNHERLAYTLRNYISYTYRMYPNVSKHSKIFWQKMLPS